MLVPVARRLRLGGVWVVRSLRRLWPFVAAVLLCLAATVFAQRRGFGGSRGVLHPLPNISYNGRFTFVRLNYTTLPGGYFYQGLPAWAHGYPLAEQNLMQIMNEVSYLAPHLEDINSLTADDPALFRYPIAYVIEVDWWDMTDREAANLGAYLQKGGFLIVDDFKVRGGFGRFGRRGGDDTGGGGGLEAFEANMKRVLPEGRFVDLDPAQPVFHAFFEIKSIDNFPQAYIAGRPIFRGLFKDNNPSKRLMVVVNYNTDISQYWEWSGRGLRPFDDTNEAYKLGINYLIYGLTH
jgi:hypothetical protein